MTTDLYSSDSAAACASYCFLNAIECQVTVSRRLSADLLADYGRQGNHVCILFGPSC